MSLAAHLGSDRQLPRRVLSLPTFLEEHKQVFIDIPLQILIIILVSIVVKKLVSRWIDRVFNPLGKGRVPAIFRPFKERSDSDRANGVTMSERSRQRALTVASLLKSGTAFLIYAIAFLLILSALGVNLAPFIAGGSVVGVALGFGAQSLIKDFLSGTFMMLEDQFGVGDTIDFELASGTVEAVGMRITQLRDVNGTVWYVRNGEVMRVGNKSQGFARVVLDIPIVDEDIDRASQAMLEVANALCQDEAWSDRFLSDPELQGVESLVRQQTELVATVRLVVQVRPGEQWAVARELRTRIRARFAEIGIEASGVMAKSARDGSTLFAADDQSDTSDG